MITQGENVGFSRIRFGFSTRLILLCLVTSSAVVMAEDVRPAEEQDTIEIDLDSLESSHNRRYEKNHTVLDKQVVSATGILTNIDDAPIHTEVITAKQLEFMQAKVLTEALRHSPGLKIQQTVKKGSKLTLQGIDANYVLILKDGLPFISPTGSATDLSQIPLVGIDRIEIIKGSGSALYGSSAMGG